MINYMAKTHTLIVRGVEKAQKNSLKRQARNKRQSVNGYLLGAIDILTCTEIDQYKKSRLSDIEKAMK